MNLLLCDRCSNTFSSELKACPACGSEDMMMVIDAFSLFPPGSISLSIAVQHSIWTFLPAAIQSSLDEMSDGRIDKKVKGKCLMAMISMAVLVEGIIGDALQNELEALLIDPETKENAEKRLKNFDGITWKIKKNVAKEIGWTLETLDCFEMVDELFKIRNNLGHGRSYKIRDTRAFKDNAFRRKEAVRIDNEEYQNAYMKLCEKGLLPALEGDPSLSAEVFLRPDVARAFYQAAISFLRSFLDTTRLKSGYNQRREFEESLK